ncbi:MAG: nucleobase:cation symporter, family [Microbacteriaceae bacterium]|nr:nucleobase:cation symporter, family [Microbacteriaceae bacterium]
MGPHDGEDAVPVVSDPGRRRATYTPPVRRIADDSRPHLDWLEQPGTPEQSDATEQTETIDDNDHSPGRVEEPSTATGGVPLSIDSVPIPIIEEAQTGSHVIAGEGFDTDLTDDADDVQLPQVAAAAAMLGPIPSPRVGEDEDVLFDVIPFRSSALSVELSTVDATPVDYRIGRATRMFWLWFATTSSLVSLGVGAALFSFGLSLRQMIVATLVGVALSFLPLGLGTLAGKWSGQPTMVVSRASFGVVGNVVPAALALVTRMFWGAVLLWLVGSTIGGIARIAGWDAGVPFTTSIGVILAIGIATAIAYFGYFLVARVQLVLTITSAVLIVGMIVVTWPAVDFATALARPDVVWLRVVTGAVLVFSFLGLLWASSMGDLARYQRPNTSGAATMLWATFGAALPPFLLISYGGLLAASNEKIATALLTDPIRVLEHAQLPDWYAVPLLLSIGVSLVSAITLTVYSGGLALQAINDRLPRHISAGIIGVAIAVIAAVLLVSVPDFRSTLTDLPTTLAVPVAAWAGIFCGEMMVRTRFNAESLVRRGGVYEDWRWVNLGALVLATVIGLGLMRSDLSWLDWEGYVYRLLGVNPDGDFAGSDIGILVALGLGLLTPLAFGISAVRRQETAAPRTRTPTHRARVASQ